MGSLISLLYGHFCHKCSKTWNLWETLVSLGPRKKYGKSQCLWVTVPAKSRKMVDHPPNMRKCSIITDQIGGRSYVFTRLDERIEQARSAKIGKNSETIRRNDNISKRMGWFDSCFFQEFAKQNSISCAWQHMLLLIRWSTLSVALKRFKAWLKHVYSTSALWLWGHLWFWTYWGKNVVHHNIYY